MKKPVWKPATCGGSDLPSHVVIGASSTPPLSDATRTRTGFAPAGERLQVAVVHVLVRGRSVSTKCGESGTVLVNGYCGSLSGIGIVNGTAVSNTPSEPADATERLAVVAALFVPSLLCAST